MNPEIKAKWVAALRSGKYQQTEGTLNRPLTGGFCCLGVLCDVYGKEKKKKAFDEFGSFLLGGKDHKESGTSQFLPGKVSRWAGFKNSVLESQSDMEFSITTPLANCLHHMNDEGYTFEEIANVIEQEL